MKQLCQDRLITCQRFTQAQRSTHNAPRASNDGCGPAGGPSRRRPVSCGRSEGFEARPDAGTAAPVLSSSLHAPRPGRVCLVTPPPRIFLAQPRAQLSRAPRALASFPLWHSPASLTAEGFILQTTTPPRAPTSSHAGRGTRQTCLGRSGAGRPRHERRGPTAPAGGPGAPAAAPRGRHAHVPCCWGAVRRRQRPPGARASQQQHPQAASRRGCGRALRHPLGARRDVPGGPCRQGRLRGACSGRSAANEPPSSTPPIATAWHMAPVAR